MFQSVRRPDVLAITLEAAGILMVTMGIRQSFGLFISPINTSTGLGVATISFALAIGQFAWGAIDKWSFFFHSVGVTPVFAGEATAEHH